MATAVPTTAMATPAAYADGVAPSRPPAANHDRGRQERAGRPGADIRAGRQRVRPAQPGRSGRGWSGRAGVRCWPMYALSVSHGAPLADAATYDGNHKCSRWMHTQ